MHKSRTSHQAQPPELLTCTPGFCRQALLPRKQQRHHLRWMQCMPWLLHHMRPVGHHKKDNLSNMQGISRCTVCTCAPQSGRGWEPCRHAIRAVRRRVVGARDQ